MLTGSTSRCHKYWAATMGSGTQLLTVRETAGRNMRVQSVASINPMKSATPRQSPLRLTGRNRRSATHHQYRSSPNIVSRINRMIDMSKV